MSHIKYSQIVPMYLQQIKNIDTIHRMQAVAKNHATLQWLLMAGYYQMKMTRRKRRWLFSHLSSPKQPKQPDYFSYWDGKQHDDKPIWIKLDEDAIWPSPNKQQP